MTTDQPAESRFWLDLVAADIVNKYPTGEIILSSGISPSASYHVGHFREIMTVDAMTWALKRLGRDARHIHVVDNFDPLRRRYDFLPESYEQYVGQPVCLIPDPFDDCRDEHKTYAEHFYREFEQSYKKMGIKPDEVVKSYEDLYSAGRMAESIEKAVDKQALIRRIFKEKSNRDLPAEWVPLQLVGPNKKLNELKFKALDKSKRVIVGVADESREFELDYAKGEVKLNWRLDWPARWQVLRVMVEPFGLQEHGAAGSSHETGVVFSKEVFGWDPPMPVGAYANIHLIGETKKMSSSLGNLVTPAEALEIMPPEILRYFIVRSKPERTLVFDPGIGLFNLIDEFSKVQEAVRAGEPAEFKEAYQFAVNGLDKPVISRVPFNHLVSLYQTARGDAAAIHELLERTGYDDVVKEQSDVLSRELEYVKNWLSKYAPDEVKFEVQAKLPKTDITQEQISFLSALAGKIEAASGIDGQKMHELIYEAKGEMKPGEAFQALYQVILGKNSGPKAGWFLASLDRDFLVARLRLQK